MPFLKQPHLEQLLMLKDLQQFHHLDKNPKVHKLELRLLFLPLESFVCM